LGRSARSGRSRAGQAVPRRGRLGPHLIHVIAARRLASHDPPGAFNRVRVVDALASLANPEHGGSDR
jgi:hypothetical protein